MPAQAQTAALPIGEVIALIGEAPRRSEASNVSPVARRMARAEGLDLTQISGSGAGGRILKRDVELVLVAREAPGTLAPASSHTTSGGPPAPLSPLAPAGPTDGSDGRPETAKGEPTTVALSKLQGTVARQMAESKARAPHFYLETVIDMTPAVEAGRRSRRRARATPSRRPTTS